MPIKLKPVPVSSPFRRSVQPKGRVINGELLELASTRLSEQATDALKKQFGEDYERNVSALNASLGLYNT